MKMLEGLLVVGIVFILPLWLFFYYRLKIAIAKNQLPKEELKQLAALQIESERLQTRIKALETILDEHNPRWRKSK
jgi:phage shock protein B